MAGNPRNHMKTNPVPHPTGPDRKMVDARRPQGPAPAMPNPHLLRRWGPGKIPQLPETDGERPMAGHQGGIKCENKMPTNQKKERMRINPVWVGEKIRKRGKAREVAVAVVILSPIFIRPVAFLIMVESMLSRSFLEAHVNTHTTTSMRRCPR